MNILAFPFEQIGQMLRNLSLWSRLGNGVAMALWIGISLLPIVPVLKEQREKERYVEHGLLILLAVVLLAVLYWMTNPALLYSWLPKVSGVLDMDVSGLLAVVKVMLGVTVWSVAVCFIVFRLLRLFRNGEKEQLFVYLRRMLYGICTLFAGAIVLEVAGILIPGLQAVQRPADGLFTVLRFTVAALPYMMDILITLSVVKLLDALLKSSHASAVTEAAHRASGLCCLALAVVTASVVVLNLLQLACMKYLSDVNVTAKIPVMSLVFVLAALLFSRLIEENKKLTEENEMFI